MPGPDGNTIDAQEETQMAKGKEDRERGAEALEPRRSGELARGGGDPYRRMMEEMDWMFDQMQRSFFGAPLLGPWMERRGMPAGWMQRMPQLHIEDKDDALILSAELPGIDPQNVKLECKDDMLVIRGEQEERAEEGRESHMSYYRQIPLPSDVDVDHADATFRHGLLRLRLPRREGAREQVKRIPIKTEAQASEAQGEGRSRAA